MRTQIICGRLVDIDEFEARVKALGKRYKRRDADLGQGIIDHASEIVQWYVKHQTNMRGNALEQILEAARRRV